MALTEQTVLIELLKEKDVEVLSCTEQFDDTPTGHFMRAAYAFNSEVEALKIAERTYRGKVHRAKLGQQLLGMGIPGYGYMWADETKSKYAINDTVFHIDQEGTEWSEYKVVIFIFDRLDEGWSTRKIQRYLLEKGIKTRYGKQAWGRQTIRQIAKCPNYTGKAVAFRWQKVEGKKGMVLRDEAETIPLPDGTIPAIISIDQFERVQKQFAINKQEAIRNSKYPEIGLLKYGLAKCGLCGHNCTLGHATPNGGTIHSYECYDTPSNGMRCRVSCRIDPVDEEAWRLAVEHIRNPHLVITRIHELLAENKERDDSTTIRKRLSEAKRRIQNLVLLAEDATDKDEIENIRGRIAVHQKEKRDLERMLVDIENEEEKHCKVQKVISDFLCWCEKVRPFIDDPDYTPTYQDKRRAVVILGIQAVIYPAASETRYLHTLKPPKIMEVLETFSGEYSLYTRIDFE